MIFTVSFCLRISALFITFDCSTAIICFTALLMYMLLYRGRNLVAQPMPSQLCITLKHKADLKLTKVPLSTELYSGWAKRILFLLKANTVKVEAKEV